VDNRKCGFRGDVHNVNTAVVEGESNSNNAECNHSLYITRLYSGVYTFIITLEVRVDAWKWISLVSSSSSGAYVVSSLVVTTPFSSALESQIGLFWGDT
jgi:hypothetical protein